MIVAYSVPFDPEFQSLFWATYNSLFVLQTSGRWRKIKKTERGLDSLFFCGIEEKKRRETGGYVCKAYTYSVR